jgi:phosphomannomutase
MNRGIFKAYDIRGVYPDELDASAARAVGRALARFLRERRDGGPGAAAAPASQPRGAPPAATPNAVVVGRDMRESGVVLREALIEGLRAERADVIDVGRVSSPMLYYAVDALGAQGGAMITASHNPGEYNGLKICRESAIPIGIESGLSEIRDLAMELEHEPPSAAPRGFVREESIQDRYRAALLELLQPRSRRRVVIDAGNGIAGEAIEPLLEQLPLDVTRLYFEPDGRFPNHEANPIKLENLEDVRREVSSQGADLGVAFDGDGDRAVFVDERGEPLPADLTTVLFIRTLVEQRLLGVGPGSTLAYDLRSSQVVPEEIHELGAVPLRSRVGHAFIKLAMRESGAVFGGELSGHYYFRFPSGYVADDGAAAFLLMLRVLECADRPLSELWTPLRRYAQSGELSQPVADPDAAIRRVKAAYADGECDELDGLTVCYADWWFNLRPSNTEPLLRLNVEAATRDEVLRRSEELLRHIGA